MKTKNNSYPMLYRCIFIAYMSLLFLWGVTYLCFLHKYTFIFVEQSQLFCFSSLYFQEFIEVPGGLAAYIGAFFTQYYIVPFLGGFIVILLIALLLLLEFLYLKLTASDWIYLSLLSASSLLLVYSFSDVNIRIGMLISMVIIFSFLFFLGRIHSAFVRISILFILIPIIYWWTGGGVFLFVILAAISETKHSNTFFAIVLFLLSTVSSIIIPLIVKRYFVLDSNELWQGISFYSIKQIPLNIYWTVLSPVIAVSIIKFFQEVFSNRTMTKTVFCLAVFIGGCITINYYLNINNKQLTELYRWDYYLKHENWDEIIQLSEQDNHHDPIFINMTNLALAKNDQLTTRLFDFEQNPTAVGVWTSNYYPMFVSGEIYYHLDMPQIARSFFFMSNTQSPNSQSPFLFRRLAEIELITDNDQIAEKYIWHLSKTLFYRNEAYRLNKMIGKSVLSDDLEVKKENQIFNPGFFAAEFKHNLLLYNEEYPNNKFVLDFLLVQCMLENDFYNFFKVISSEGNLLGNNFPIVYQEFILMYGYIINDNSLVEKYNLSQTVVRDFYNYLNINQENLSDEIIKEKLFEYYGNTYWFYAQYKNRIKFS